VSAPFAVWESISPAAGMLLRRPLVFTSGSSGWIRAKLAMHHDDRSAAMRYQSRLSDAMSRTEELVVAETCMMGMAPSVRWDALTGWR